VTARPAVERGRSDGSILGWAGPGPWRASPTARLFRGLGNGGRVLAEPLAPEAVADIVNARAAAAGLDPEGFAGHSLRAGLLTSGAEAGASILRLMGVSRHKSVDTLGGYVRRAEPFKDHAGSAFL
jgi:hypothetical protein